MTAPETPVDVVASALDQYADLDEFQPLEGFVLKALSDAGYEVVRSESALVIVARELVEAEDEMDILEREYEETEACAYDMASRQAAFDRVIAARHRNADAWRALRSALTAREQAEVSP